MIFNNELFFKKEDILYMRVDSVGTKVVLERNGVVFEFVTNFKFEYLMKELGL